MDLADHVDGGFVSQAGQVVDIRNLKLIKITGEFDLVVFDQFLDGFGGDAFNVQKFTKEPETTQGLAGTELGIGTAKKFVFFGELVFA